MQSMRLKKGYAVTAALTVVCILGVIAGSRRIAVATPGSGFVATDTTRSVFDDIHVMTNARSDRHQVQIRTKGRSDVYVVTNTVQPGGFSGWHTHPGPSIVSVKAGTAVIYSGDDPTCTPHVVNEGEGFIDPGGGHLHNVRNESGAELVLVAFQIVPFGAQRRIDAPNPGDCPF